MHNVCIRILQAQAQSPTNIIPHITIFDYKLMQQRILKYIARLSSVSWLKGCTHCTLILIFISQGSHLVCANMNSINTHPHFSILVNNANSFQADSQLSSSTSYSIYSPTGCKLHYITIKLISHKDLWKVKWHKRLCLTRLIMITVSITMENQSAVTLYYYACNYVRNYICTKAFTKQSINKFVQQVCTCMQLVVPYIFLHQVALQLHRVTYSNVT